MDVTCDRCRTEYEFDDALVSERGTTVKCTNCGFQFKVRRNDGTALPERWLVRTVDGRELEFMALRELQAAIAQTRITKEDVLSRGGSRPRRLGSIAELEPFFVNAQGSPGVGGGRMGIAMPPPRTEVSVAIPLPVAPPRSYGDRSSAPPIVAPAPDSRPRRNRVATLPGVLVSSENAPPLPANADRTPLAQDASAPSPRAGALPSIGPNGTQMLDPSTDADTIAGPRRATSEPPTIPRRAATSDPPQAVGRRRVSDPPPQTPTPSDVRTSYAHEDSLFGEPRFSSLRPSKRGDTARWIAGVVALGLVVFITVSVGRKYFGSGAHATTAPGADERIAAFVRDGDKSLAEGDIDTANQQFAKASALAESDPRVESALARIAVVEAEIQWLHARLLDAADPDLVVIKKRLDPLVDRATKATARALDAQPNDPVVVRARIDALRIAGDRGGARALVDRLKSTTSQPDTQLALAALEVTEDKPDWSTATGRLRAAANAEQDLARARALLVYALARSGDFAGARAETDRLAELKRPHPLVPALRAFVARSEKGTGIDVAALPDNKKDADKTDDKAAAKPAEHPAEHHEAAPAPAPHPPRDRHKAGDAATAKPADGRVPDDFVAPGQQVDTSDLPGAKAAPKATAGPRATAAPAAPPPGVDTSDLPGAKK